CQLGVVSIWRVRTSSRVPPSPPLSSVKPWSRALTLSSTAIVSSTFQVYRRSSAASGSVLGPAYLTRLRDDDAVWRLTRADRAPRRRADGIAPGELVLPIGRS